ncbi:MAG TPA: histone deacetylase [Candidatus Hydrogenedentes bacterium]|nr:histone deacetylase [Candidatus Hydrogenedentota bacterium]
MAKTGYIYREECLKHVAGPHHPERPERLEAIDAALARAGVALTKLPCRPASREDLLRVHSAAHIDAIERTCREELPYPDPDTSMAAGSWEAALLAAGGCIAACGAVLAKRVDNAFCAVRPPGHHAERDRAMGFCLFNNVAIAARWLQIEKKVLRIAIVDWDVHHGNGTQHTFYDDPSVYYASLHQHPLYPGTGDASERGAANTNLNIPMPPGTGPGAWLEALEKQVLPELRRFEPEVLLMSAGFDAHRLDPLASQRLESATFGEITRQLLSLNVPAVVSVLEGGYNLDALGESVVEHVKALHGA